jgi:hypothetical protein
MNAFKLFGFRAWKSQSVHATHLTASVPCGNYGYFLKTAAFPFLSNCRALAGCVGANGRFFKSLTNTFDIVV